MLENPDLGAKVDEVPCDPAEEAHEFLDELGFLRYEHGVTLVRPPAGIPDL